MGFLAVIVGVLLGKPSVITAHGSDVHTQALRGRTPVRWPIRWALRHASRIIAVSEELVSILTGIGVSRARIIYISNGVDLELFSIRVKTEARQELGLEREGIYFLNVAALVPVKGQQYLIEAFREVTRRIPSARLYVLGDGELADELRESVNRDGLPIAVSLQGRVAYDQIPTWMSACDVFVLSSLNEGTPLTALEALSSGKPVVATRVGGIPEVIEEERHGILVDPANSKQLAEALIRCTQTTWDPALNRRQAGQYAWSVLIGRVYETYEELMKEQG